MTPDSPFSIVQAWQDAVNSQDIDRLLDLSDPNIEIVGPRGSAHGHQVLRDWLGRAGLTLITLRAFARDHVVVLAQHGVWRAVDTGEAMGEADLASRFHVANRRVTLYARYDDLATALTAAHLTEADELLIGA